MPLKRSNRLILVPEDIIHPIVSASVLTWFLIEIYSFYIMMFLGFFLSSPPPSICDFSLFRQSCLLGSKEFCIIWFSNIFTLTVPGEGYHRNVPRIKVDIYVFIFIRCGISREILAIDPS